MNKSAEGLRHVLFLSVFARCGNYSGMAEDYCDRQWVCCETCAVCTTSRLTRGFPRRVTRRHSLPDCPNGTASSVAWAHLHPGSGIYSARRTSNLASAQNPFSLKLPTPPAQLMITNVLETQTYTCYATSSRTAYFLASLS